MMVEPRTTKRTSVPARGRVWTMPPAVLAAVAVLWAAGAGPSTARAESAPRKAVSLTIYNNDFALVKDVRVLSLQKGTSVVRLDDVAASIDPTSVHIAPLDHPGKVTVLEQNYQYDLADADRLLSRYLNHEVTAVLKGGDTRTGTLLSFNDGSLVLASDAGAVVVNRREVRDIRLGKIPGGLVVKPTLVWRLASRRSGDERTEISYLTDNIKWHAEYVAVVNQDDSGLKLDGWVSLDNRSGATYEKARLKLVAGDVHRVRPVRPIVPMEGGRFAKAVARPQFEEHGFFEYHVYTLDRPATVADRETKQLSLFPSAETSARKVFTYDGAREATKVTVRMEFVNSKKNGLGMALPAGKVRVYKEDTDGALEFVGEDAIDHTPRDETVRLYLGNAFDLVGERKRTDRRKIGERTREESFEIQLRNHKDEAVEVVIVEHLFGDWVVLRNSHDYRKKDAQTIEFPVQVEANGETTVTYTARTTW